MTDDHGFDFEVDLASALRALPVPEHGADFWDELEARLAEEAPPAPARRLPFRRRPYLGLGLLAAAAVAVVVVATVLLGDSEPGTRVISEPPTTAVTTPLPGRYRPGPEQPLGEGALAGVSADGSAALVVAPDSDSDRVGCEGTGPTTLFAAPLDGGARRRSLPRPDDPVGELDRSPADPARVAITETCEDFLTSLVVAGETPGGILSDLRPVEGNLLNDLFNRFVWSADGSGLLGVTQGAGDVVRIDADTGARTTVLAGARALSVTELADGSLVVLTTDGRLRLGDQQLTIPANFVKASPDRRQVAAYGQDGLWLVTPGEAPRQLTSDPVDSITWAPDGRALAVAGPAPYPAGGPLSIVSLDGGLTVLTTTGAAGAGEFTPDGRALVFTRLEAGGGGGNAPAVERVVVVRFE